MPAAEAGLQRGTLIKQHVESFGNQKFEIRNLNGANGMSDMAGNAAR